MKQFLGKSILAASLLLGSTIAQADFGVGVKAGTLGVGIEGRWAPLPWMDVRLGANQYDFDTSGSEAGINYDATFSMDNYFLTGNLRFPLSPFRLTAGAFSNGNELLMVSQDTGGNDFLIDDTAFSASDVGVLRSTTVFEDISPYIGVGYDFEVFGKMGLNLDFGVLWQGEPIVSLESTGFANASPQVQAVLGPALEAERVELENEITDYKAWPVLSLSFVYNF